ncbi:MAG: hypothetical protein R3C56_26900 [Pirellulaceae bacterium]
MQLAKKAGFDGIELNYDLDNDLSPKASDNDLLAIRHMADEVGIDISGLCSFLFWPYPLTSNDVSKRNRGIELAGLMAGVCTRWASPICSSSPVRYTFRGETITNRSPMMFVNVGQRGHRQTRWPS